MAFNYESLTTIKGDITQATEELTTLLSDFSDLIDANVNNAEVWKGKSASGFKTKWDEFVLNDFPQYKNIFSKQIENVTTSLNAYSSAEGSSE